MANLIIVPARYASTRFKGKALAPLKGASGNALPLVVRSWQAAVEAAGEKDKVVVATDDARIQKVATEAGAEVVMTPVECRNGTERCAAAVTQIPTSGDYDVIVNLQGDAPLTPPWFVKQIADALRFTPDHDVATPVMLCDGAQEQALRADRRAGRVGGTTATVTHNGRALYFSKEVIPYLGDSGRTKIRLHVGVYAYRPKALKFYAGLPPGELEIAEGLEQLRFLENNYYVYCCEVDGRGRPFWEVNNPSDIKPVEQALSALGIE